MLVLHTSRTFTTPNIVRLKAHNLFELLQDLVVIKPQLKLDEMDGTGVPALGLKTWSIAIMWSSRQADQRHTFFGKTTRKTALGIAGSSLESDKHVIT